MSALGTVFRLVRCTTIWIITGAAIVATQSKQAALCVRAVDTANAYDAHRLTRHSVSYDLVEQGRRGP